LFSGLLLYVFRDLWTTNPFARDEPFNNIYQIAADPEGAVYAITDSKRIARKVDASGNLVYAIASDDGGDAGSVRLFEAIAADRSGNAYVLKTILDGNGLYVIGEELIRISADGSDTRLLYRAEYTTADNLLRVGRLQGLAVEDGNLYFFQKDDAKASLLSLPVGADATVRPAVVGTIEMPEDRYLKELTGHAPERIFFTTKRGTLYAVANREASPIYPQAGSRELHFPVEIATEDHARVYFIDRHDQAVYSVNMDASGYPVRALVTIDRLMTEHPGPEWSDFVDLAVADGQLTVTAADHLIRLDATGRITDVTDAYRYPISTVLKRLAYWLLIALTAVLAAFLFRAVYIDLLKRRISLLLKQLAAIFPIVLISMWVLSDAVYNSFTSEMKSSFYQQLELLAVNGRNLVDGDRLERLRSPRDYMSEDYQAIRRSIDEVFAGEGADREGLYNTIYRYMDGGLYLIMDDDDSVTMFQPFPLSEENLLVLEKGEIVSGEFVDASGEWIYALGPIRNSAGEVVGIYETGKDLIVLHQSNEIIQARLVNIFVIIGLILLAAISLMTFYLLSSINKLRRNVNLFAVGEWDVQVNLRTRDEVEELGDRFNMMARSIRRYIQEMTRLNNAYFRFVPQQFLKVLGKTNMAEVQLGEQQNRRVTVLVCQMRNFAEFSAGLTTEENFRFINSFLKTFGPVIREFGGFTSRYLGPGMLTLFPNDAASALKAAVKLRATLEQYNERRRNRGYEPVEIGIAVHTGDVMLGIIGEEQRMEGSVVSHHVDLTLDLEYLSAKLGAFILLTGDTMRSLRPQMIGQYRRLGVIQVDEEQPPLELFDWFEGDPEQIRRLKIETKAQFEAAVAAFEQGRFYDAREGFVAVVKKNRFDLAAQLYFYECDRLWQQGADEGWNQALRIS
jgi:class 3 adenylate cyclase/HAMP domain-containing protein